MDILISFIVFVVVLSIIIIIHELGHLIAAKKFGVYCSEFSIGMGPAIYQYKKSETTISIRALPLGGYVQMAGEEGSDIEGIPFERTINGIKTWKQVVVMAAGATLNILLAFAIFIGVVMARGYVSAPSDPVVGSVVENSPAATVGMMEGDRIVKMVLPDGEEIIPETFDDLVNGMSNYTGGSVIYTIERGSETINFVVEPQYDETLQRYLVGFNSQPKVRAIAWYESFYYGAEMLFEMMSQIIQAFGNLIRGVGLQDVSGPIGIYQATSQVASEGLNALILWVGLLSLNIGIFNLFPIPILDGGRIIIVIIEKLIGRRISEKIQTAIMLAGLALIVLLMVFATANDIGRLF